MMDGILFIGCGRGQEIEAYADDASAIVGLEPSGECRRDAQRRLSARGNVTILPDSIFDYHGGRFDRIYAIFPAPPMLMLREEAFAAAIVRLLAADGCFFLYSEIWPDMGNRAACLSCERLKRLLCQSGLRVSERILDLAGLPGFVRRSGFLARARSDTPLTFREIVAQRSIDNN